MIVTCPGCNSNYRVRNEAVPPQGARMKCPTCATMFLAKRPANAAPEPVPAATSAFGSPAPAFGDAPAKPDPFAAAAQKPASTLMAFPAVDAAPRPPTPPAPASSGGGWQDPFAPPPTQNRPAVPPAQTAGGPAATFLAFPAAAPQSTAPVDPFRAPSPSSTLQAFPAAPDPFAGGAAPKPPTPNAPAPVANPAATLMAFPAVGAPATAPAPAAGHTATLMGFGAVNPPPAAPDPKNPFDGMEGMFSTNAEHDDGGDDDAISFDGGESLEIDSQSFNGRQTFGDEAQSSAQPKATASLDIRDEATRDAFAAEARSRNDLPPPVVDYAPHTAPTTSLGATIGSWVLMVAGMTTLLVGATVALWGFSIAPLDGVLTAPLESSLSIVPARSMRGADLAPLASLIDDANALAVRGDSEGELLIWNQVLQRDRDHGQAKQRAAALTEQLRIQR